MPVRERRGASVMFQEPGGKVLFLRRSKGVDHSGEWCFPGGTTDGQENAEATARREVREEVGFVYTGPLAEVGKLCRQEITFTTFMAPVSQELEPRLNWEHTDYAWASLNSPPRPLHPGVEALLSILKTRALKGLLVGRLTKAKKPGKTAVTEPVQPVTKEWTASTSATSGITSYGSTKERRKKRRVKLLPKENQNGN